MPTSKDFTYTRALFNLFWNVMNYRNSVRECRLSVKLPSWNAIMHYTHALYYAIILRTCSLENNAFSVLHNVINVTLHYPMLHRFEIHSQCLGTFAHGFIMLLPRSLASSRSCSSAINFWKQSQFFFALYMQYIPPFHMCRRTFQCLTALYWFKLQIKRVHNKSIRWVQLLFNFVDLTKTMQLSAFMYSNCMYQGFKAIMHFQTIINNRYYCRAGKTQVWLPRAGKFWSWSSKNRSLVAQGASKISLVVLWVCLKVSA